LRRLFSTFARGLPGVGLLLMRLVAGVVLIAHGIGRFLIGTPLEASILNIFSIGDAVLLIAGLWTPIAGSLLALLTVFDLITQDGNPYSTILLATMGAALALVGPGAWSLDAWLFGWKRIDIDRR
jgi:putative oxidoreductase